MPATVLPTPPALPTVTMNGGDHAHGADAQDAKSRW